MITNRRTKCVKFELNEMKWFHAMLIDTHPFTYHSICNSIYYNPMNMSFPFTKTYATRNYFFVSIDFVNLYRLVVRQNTAKHFWRKRELLKRRKSDNYTAIRYDATITKIFIIFIPYVLSNNTQCSAVFRVFNL